MIILMSRSGKENFVDSRNELLEVSFTLLL